MGDGSGPIGANNRSRRDRLIDQANADDLQAIKLILDRVMPTPDRSTLPSGCPEAAILPPMAMRC
jgi:hypothetical protein